MQDVSAEQADCLSFTERSRWHVFIAAEGEQDRKVFDAGDSTAMLQRSTTFHHVFTLSEVNMAGYSCWILKCRERGYGHLSTEIKMVRVGVNHT